MCFGQFQDYDVGGGNAVLNFLRIYGPRAYRVSVMAF